MSDKKRKLGNRYDEYTDESEPTFGTRDFDDDVMDALAGEQVTSDTLNIMDIRADITQPRQILPREIGQWNGMPDGVPTLLEKWMRAAGGTPTIAQDILRGKRSVHDHPWGDSLAGQFADLLSFANNIFDLGLQQSIGVATIENGYQIIYGERRWWAFHCLALWLGKEWLHIPAKVAHVSEWELAKIQAGENFQRQELTAIAEARNFAKLLMKAREHAGFSKYKKWHEVVTDDRTSLAYYEQVADGDQHGIPYGMGVEFESALRKNKSQLSRLRQILAVTDDVYVNDQIWVVAERQKWAEGFMRDIRSMLETSFVRLALGNDDPESILRDEIKRIRDEEKASADDKTLPIGNVLPEIASRTVPIGTHLPEEDVPHQPDNVTQLPPKPQMGGVFDSRKRYELTQKYLNKRVTLRGGKEGVVISVETTGIRVRLDDGATPIVSESVIEGTKYVPGEADPVTRRVEPQTQTPPPAPPQPSPQAGREQAPQDDYTPPAYLDEQDDGSDNMLSVDGDEETEVIDGQGQDVIDTIRTLMTLAQRLGNQDAYDALDSLFCLSSHEIWLLAEMDEDVAESQVIGYAQAVSVLLEHAMLNVEHYTSTIREMVKDERERE